MSTNKPRRRWFQFRLRSVLLLMLAIALWLGYEVNWASRQQRHVAAIEELGGSVEYESYRWSLLRFYDAKKYGRTVAKAKIPGTRVADTRPHLRELSHLRRLSVVYDGTCDLYPGLNQLRAALPKASAVPVGTTLVGNGTEDSESDRTQECLEELALTIVSRLRKSVRRNDLANLDARTSDSKLDDPEVMFDRLKSNLTMDLHPSGGSSSVYAIDTRFVPMTDGATGEIIRIYYSAGNLAGGVTETATVLLVRDRIADWRPRNQRVVVDVRSSRRRKRRRMDRPGPSLAYGFEPEMVTISP